MKRQQEWFITLIMTIIVSCNMKFAYAKREYLPILEDGKSWVLVEKRKPMLPDEKDVAYYDVRVTGNITIEDRVCKKVSFVGRDENSSWEEILYEENGLLCAVQDFGNGNYSFAPLIDLTLKKGDKVDILDGCYFPPEILPDNYIEVLDSGTVTTLDGIDRKTLDVTTGWNNETWVGGAHVWVEGIGCNGNILLTSFPGATDRRWIYFYIDCCMKDGEVLFTKSDFDKLLSKYSGIDKTGYNDFLTVNYTEGSVSAVCDGNDVLLELYSLEGRLISWIRSSEKAVLETSALPDGIYIAKATSGKTSAVRKLVL